MSKAIKNREIVFGSKLSNMILVDNFVHEISTEAGLDDDQYGDVLIALNDAVKNAIEHGNKEDASKKVRVSVQNDSKHLIFSVSDEGSGFDYHHVPDPTLPQNLEKERGRGIHLIKNLSNRLDFENGGATLKIWFNI